MLFDKPSLTPVCIPDRMAENMKEEQEVEKTNIKDEIFSLQEEILLSSTVEDTCTVYVQEEILPSSTVEDTCTVYNKEEHVEINIAEIKDKLSRLFYIPGLNVVLYLVKNGAV